MAAEDEVEVRLALVCSGGVSLGAFHAGALLEATRLLTGHAARPVRIDVLTGASAGGLVLAVLLRQLAAGRDLAALEEALAFCGVRGLGCDYPDRDPDDAGRPDPRQLLPELEGHAEVGLLASEPVRRALERTVVEAAGTGPPSPLLGRPTALGLALTNLHGVDVGDGGAVAPAPSGEDPAADALGTTWFDDRIRFLLGSGGEPDAVDPATGARVLTGVGPDDVEGWRTLARAARASAASPGAFAPVTLERRRAEYGPRWPADLADRDRFRFAYADGGLLRNEPFGEALALAAGRDAADPRPHERVFVLVDPNVTGPRSVRALDFESEWSLVTRWADGRPAAQRLHRRGYAGKLLAYLGHLGAVVAAQARLAPAVRDGAARDARVVAVTPLSLPAPLQLAGAFMGNFGGFLAEAWRRHDFEAGRHVAAEVLRACGPGGPGISPGVPRLLDPAAPRRPRPDPPAAGGYPTYRDADPVVRGRLEDVLRGHARRLAEERHLPGLLGDLLGSALAGYLERRLEAPEGTGRYLTVRLTGVAAGEALAPADGADRAEAVTRGEQRALETVVALRRRPRAPRPYRLEGPHVLEDEDGPNLEVGRAGLLALGWAPSRVVRLAGEPEAWYVAARERRLLEVGPEVERVGPDALRSAGGESEPRA